MHRLLHECCHRSSAEGMITSWKNLHESGSKMVEVSFYEKQMHHTVANEQMTYSKDKEFMGSEARVIGHQDGKGKWVLSSVMYSRLEGFSDREWEWDNAPRIGSTITCRYFELTNDGKPRHPTFVRVRPSDKMLIR
jgi:hypothetical protein